MFFLAIFTDLVCLPVTVLSRSVGTLWFNMLATYFLCLPYRWDYSAWSHQTKCVYLFCQQSHHRPRDCFVLFVFPLAVREWICTQRDLIKNCPQELSVSSLKKNTTSPTTHTADEQNNSLTTRQGPAFFAGTKDWLFLLYSLAWSRTLCLTSFKTSCE